MSKFESSFQSRKDQLLSFTSDLLRLGKKEEEEENPDEPELSDDYQIKNVIATGGLKVIRRIRDRKSGRDVALAQLRPDFQSPTNKERFLREARILASMEHANIVPIYEINYDRGDRLFFIMKLLSGETLASVLKKIRMGDEEYLRNYSLKKRLRIFLELCNAVGYTHSKGIVHLDIKPSNIQISDFDEVYLIDWGMAKIIGSSDSAHFEETDLPSFTPLSGGITKVGSVNGTPGYMSPEQTDTDGGPPAKASDIYSLGATLYSILYAKPPYFKNNEEEIIEKTRSGELPDFEETIDGKVVPNALRAIAKKAMSHDAGERYSSVEQLREDVLLYMNDFSTLAEGVNFKTFSQLFLKRHYRIISLILGIVFLIGTIVNYSYQEINKQTQIAQEQTRKVNATADEIITGTIEKEKLLRQERAYDQLMANYEKLREVGYDFPRFWYNEARLYAGELQFDKVLEYLGKIEVEDDPIKATDEYDKMLRLSSWALDIAKERPLTHEEIIEYSLNMDAEVKDHILWNINNDPEKTLENKLKLFDTSVRMYNQYLPPEAIQFSYEIKDGYVKVDLSNTPRLMHVEPLLGLDIDELNLSRTNVNINSISGHLKKELSVLEISDNKVNFIEHYLSGGKLEKLVARNTFYSAFDFEKAPKLKYLDIEGSHVGVGNIYPSDNLEYLNIAYSDFDQFLFLSKLNGLKTLVIDEAMVLPTSVQKTLAERNVEIIVKELASLSGPIFSMVQDLLEKDREFRREREYDELLAKYNRVDKLGYSDPEFWFKKARVHAGELEFERVIRCFNQVDDLEAYFKYSNEYEKMLFHAKLATERSKIRALNHDEIMEYARNMDMEVQDHILWNMNQNPDLSIEQRLALLKRNLQIYNPQIVPDKFHFEYEIDGDYVKLDISGNREMDHVEPMLGVPVDEIDMSGNIANMTSVSQYLKKRVKVINVSGYKFTFINNFFTLSGYEKIIARQTSFRIMNFADALKLKYLDAEGSRFLSSTITPSNYLEYLNIAFSNFRHYDLLEKFGGLKTLVISKGMGIPPMVLDSLEERGVEVIVKTKRD